MTGVDYDWEFLEDGVRIEPISIGMVADDGRTYYAVNGLLAARGWKGWRFRRRVRKHKWLMENVVPNLPQPHGDWNLHMPKSWLFNYLDPAVKPVHLWANYSAYDHVCLAQLWGRMIDLPEGVPMFTNDIQQERVRLGIPWDALPKQESGEHNALADARHNQTVRHWLAEQEARTS